MSQSVYSQSRSSIISWINDTLLLPVSRIEQLGSGSIYCQLLDAAYPERVPLHRVKWEARLEIDFLHNFKILQNSFEILGINKKIDIQKLVRAKYQDNLEFVQWLKAFIETKIDHQKYEPLKRRNYAKVFLGFLDKAKCNNINNKQNQEQLIKKSSSKNSLALGSSALLNSRCSTGNQRINPFATKNTLKVYPSQGSRTSRQSQTYNGQALKKGKSPNSGSYLELSQKKNLKTGPKLGQLYLLPEKPVVAEIEIVESAGSDDQVF